MKIIKNNGEVVLYYKNGKLHRDNGPAIKYRDGTLVYYKNGKLHREDGPAFMDDYIDEYWLNGKQLTEDQFFRNMKK